MPVYLLHGFRWPRRDIRVYIVINNVDDASAEWIIAPLTSAALFESFTENYPGIMDSLPHLKFVEQFDEKDESPAAASQPFAFVADKVRVCGLSCDVDAVRGEGIDPEAWGALIELRDKLAPGEKVGWFVVYNGDEERRGPPTDYSGGDRNEAEESSQERPKSAGLKSLFRRH
ncbi:MAG: hypothetical protein M1827_005670 [Pycnora praestabilis]|nr:MAG: hypothetical protein M1827_005670 [Pycnora praestabilis]